MSIYPDRKDIQWLSGWDEMRNYRFGSRNRDHKLSGNCGSSVCINCLENWDVGDVTALNVGWVSPRSRVSYGATGAQLGRLHR